MIEFASVGAHSNRQDCWVIINGSVYDLTDFALQHPGGGGVITDLAGTDATEAFSDVHEESVIKATLTSKQLEQAYKGRVDPSTVVQRNPKRTATKSAAKAGQAHFSLKDCIIRLSGGLAVMGVALLIPDDGLARVDGKAVQAIYELLPQDTASSLTLESLRSMIGCGFVFVAILLSLPFVSSFSKQHVLKSKSSNSDGAFNTEYGAVDAQFVTELTAVVGAENVHEGADSDAAAKRSKDMSFHAPAAPDIVVLPFTPEEVAAIVKLCAERQIPVTPRGAGSGLEGGCIPYSGGVCLDLMRMKTVTLNKPDMQATVQPGLKKLELGKFLEGHNLLFGPDPASNPSIGGMASTSGSGLSTVMYGTTRENVISLLVVTPTGELLRTRQCVRKSSTGYELTQLYVGSEGTLGVIVELTVKIHPILPVRCGAIMRFETVSQAADTVIGMVQSQLPTLCRCEMLNTDGVRATNKRFNQKLQPIPTIFLEFRAQSTGPCEGDAQRAEVLAKENHCVEFKFTTNASELDGLWEARRGCYIAAMSYRELKGDKVFLTDTCVPISRLSQMIAETEKDFVDRGFLPAICAHIADGNFHCCVPYQPDEYDRVVELEHRMISRAISMGGTVSGEHGIGVGKRAHMLEEHGECHVCVQKAIKQALDPSNIMNPGKIFMYEGDRVVKH
jgi:D-lactate dehydrogenase (cytochrome)